MEDFLKIENFQQRHKAQYIYETYFDEDSPHFIGFGLFDTLHFYGVIDGSESKSLAESFEIMQSKLFVAMENFDKENITR